MKNSIASEMAFLWCEFLMDKNFMINSNLLKFQKSNVYSINHIIEKKYHFLHLLSVAEADTFQRK